MLGASLGHQTTAKQLALTSNLFTSSLIWMIKDTVLVSLVEGCLTDNNIRPVKPMWVF